MSQSDLAPSTNLPDTSTSLATHYSRPIDQTASIPQLQRLPSTSLGKGQGWQEVLPSMSFGGPEHLPETVIESVSTQTAKWTACALGAQKLAKSVSASLTERQGPRLGHSERPIVRHYEGVDNLVVDIELPGLAPEQVEIFYENMELHLFAEKADDAAYPASLRRIYEGLLRADCITCGMRHGVLRVVLQCVGPEEGTDSPQGENLQVLDNVPFNFK
ncbi:hypothetical protein AB1N83_012300 [Pleurotus pulmonarius]